MSNFQKLLSRLNGLRYPQEYLCLAKGTFTQSLNAYLIIDGRVIEDITKTHNFVGYSPVIFALSSNLIPADKEEITLAYSSKLFYPNEKFIQKDAVALLKLKRIRTQVIDELPIQYFEGTKGEHRFLSSFHQYIIQLQNRLFQKKPGNVYLPGNLYRQVQIAYSSPRNISLITVGQHENYNLFPTDLHGPVSVDHYIISLRHEGKACAQVLHTKRILLSRVPPRLYKTVYSLGKNHMQEMKTKEFFPFSNELSELLKLPVPESTHFYRELELLDSFIHGIHRVILFKVLNRQQVQEDGSSLFHIHNVFASWLYNKGLAGNYLLR